MMGPPAGLYYFFGLVMLAIAAYCLVLVANSFAVHRTVGRDVEIAHVFMGLAMAGMFVPRWAFGPNGLWEVVFGALLAWFIVLSVQSVQRYGLHVPHTVIHALMSLAMLLMYWFPRAAMAGTMSVSMAAHGHRIDPGVAFLLAFILLGSAIFTVASPNRGASHFGTHGPGHVKIRVNATADGSETGVVLKDAHGIASPWAADATHVVMCVAMGLMLLLML
jgi:uncharacterized protein DUF5134